MYRARGAQHCFEMLFYVLYFGNINSAVRAKSRWAMFHGGSWAKLAISAKGVQGRTNIGSAPILYSTVRSLTENQPCSPLRLAGKAYKVPGLLLVPYFEFGHFDPYPRGLIINPKPRTLNSNSNPGT